jgi:GWxTD domain-containing protein
LRLLQASPLRYAAACAALALIVAGSIGTFFLVVSGAGSAMTAAQSVELRTAFRLAAGGVRVDSTRFALDGVLPWITPIWLAGVFLFALRQVVSCAAAQRLRRRGACAAPDVWQQRVDDIRARLKIARPVVLLESCMTRVPIVIGHFRPVILAPLGLWTCLTAEQVELILMHELAHVHRSDYLINMLQAFVEVLMFYNPAVRWISKTIRTEREHVCDDLVVSQAGSARAYAGALTALEESRSDRVEFAIAATGGDTVKRIRRLLSKPAPARSQLLPALGAVAVTLLVIGFLAAPSFTGAAQVELPGPYMRWLQQEVAYIITDAERAVFEGLSSNAERDRFIEQFWLRRDPTPGTPANEYRDELRRRIDYANSNFATRLPGVAGWQTDRGRMFIQFGNPDEIESHPGPYVRPDGSLQQYPSHLWLYRFIEGVGNNVLVEFADTKGTGEYPRVAGAPAR